MYGSVSSFRSKSGLSSTDIDDSTVQDLLSEASRRVLNDISRLLIYEELEGDINGSNKYFYTKHTPIADNDMDKDIDTSDVSVYAYREDTSSNNITLTSLTVSSIDAYLGKIVLASAPSSNTVDKVVITYRYYVSGKIPDWSLVDLATVYYACYLAYITEKGLLPVTFRLGSLAYSYGRGGVDKPHRIFLRLYENTINQIRGRYVGV